MGSFLINPITGKLEFNDIPLKGTKVGKPLTGSIEYNRAKMALKERRELFRSDNSDANIGYSQFPEHGNSQYVQGDIADDWWGLPLENWNVQQWGNKVYNTNAVTYTAGGATFTGDGAGNITVDSSAITPNFADNLAVGMALKIDNTVNYQATGVGGNNVNAIVTSIIDSNNFIVSIQGNVSAVAEVVAVASTISTQYQLPDSWVGGLNSIANNSKAHEIWLKPPASVDVDGSYASYYDGGFAEGGGADWAAAWYRTANQAIAGGTKHADTLFSSSYGQQGFFLASRILNENGPTIAPGTSDTPQASIQSFTNSSLDGGASPELYTRTRSNAPGNAYGGGFWQNQLSMKPGGFNSGYNRQHANTGGYSRFESGGNDAVGDVNTPQTIMEYVHNNGTSGGENAQWSSYLHFNRFGQENLQLAYKNNVNELPGSGRWNDREMIMRDADWRFHMWGDSHLSTRIDMFPSTNTNEYAGLALDAAGDVALDKADSTGRNRYLLMRDNILSWHYNIDTVFGNRLAVMNIDDTRVEMLRNNVSGNNGLIGTRAYGFRIRDNGLEIEPGGSGTNRRPAFYSKTVLAAEFTDPDHIPNVRYVDDAIAGAGGDYETAQTYTVSNVTPDRVFDPTATTPNETAHVLATLIQDLKNLTDILL